MDAAVAGLEGFYPRWGRPCLRAVLFLLSLPPAAVLGALIALANALLFRSFRRILYTQPRVGHQGRIFRIYKFRTLRASSRSDFDSWRQDLDRSRVTRFGSFLRNAHLDELPQLWNIWRGEMDFIGPRPEMLEIHRWARERIPRFDERCALLPGVTGLAQVTLGHVGMDVRAYARKLALDQRYLRKRCLALDLAILLRTAAWMLGARGWQQAPDRAGGSRPRAGAMLLAAWQPRASSSTPCASSTTQAGGTPSGPTA